MTDKEKKIEVNVKKITELAQEWIMSVNYLKKQDKYTDNILENLIDMAIYTKQIHEEE